MRALLWLVILVPVFVASAGEEKPTPLRLEVTLTDGSRIKGEIVPPFRPLDVSSPVIGKLAIPLTKIAGVTFGADHKDAAIRLRNGDKLQGSLGVEAVKITTLFGPISVPLSTIQELEFRSGEHDRTNVLLGPDDWELLPFPSNCDWPGNKGKPAKLGETDILVQGQPVRSRRTFTVPLTVECEVTLEQLPDRAGGFLIFLLPPGIEADMQPERAQLFRLGFEDPNGEPLDTTPYIERYEGSLRGTIVWKGGTFLLKPRVVYRLKLEISATGWRIAINDRTYETTDVTIPYDKVMIELWNWQPSTRWRVSNFRVH